MIASMSNGGAVQALRALGAAQSALSASQKRLTTGLKINSARDDGAGFVISRNLRNTISDEGVLQQNRLRARSLLDVTQASVSDISDILVEMKEKALALTDTSLDTVSRAALTTDLKALRDQIDKTTENSEFNGVNLLTSEITPTYFPTTNNSTYAATGSGSATIPASITGGSIEILLKFSGITSYSLTVDQGDGMVYTTGQTWAMPHTQTMAFASGYQPDNAATDHTFSYNFTSVGPGASPGTLASWIKFTPYEQSTKLSINPDGSALEVVHKPMTAATLGMDDLDNLTTDETLAAVESALGRATTYAAYYGNLQNTIDGLIAQGQKTTDTYEQAYGDIVDADLSRESANWQARQTQVSLAAQSLAIANQAPKMLLNLFR